MIGVMLGCTFVLQVSGELQQDSGFALCVGSHGYVNHCSSIFTLIFTTNFSGCTMYNSNTMQVVP